MSAPIYFYFHSVRIPAKHFCAVASLFQAFNHHHDHEHRPEGERPPAPAPFTDPAAALDYLIDGPCPLPPYDEYHDPGNVKMRERILKDGFISYGDEEQFECSAMSDFCFHDDEWVDILADHHDYSANKEFSIRRDGTQQESEDDCYFDARIVNGKIVLQKLYRQSDYEEWDQKAAIKTAADPAAFEPVGEWRAAADKAHAEAMAKRAEAVAFLRKFKWYVADTHAAKYLGLVSRDSGSDDILVEPIFAVEAKVKDVPTEYRLAVAQKMLRDEYGFDEETPGFEIVEYIVERNPDGTMVLVDMREDNVFYENAPRYPFTLSELAESRQPKKKGG